MVSPAEGERGRAVCEVPEKVCGGTAVVVVVAGTVVEVTGTVVGAVVEVTGTVVAPDRAAADP